jgi:protein-disulfide isomerase
MDLRRSPCKGPEKAPTLVVVFSDFQCPACAFGRRLLEAVSEETGERLRLCFKNLPLRSIHPHARLAAQAAMAAHLQGRFWPMHDLLYDNQHALDRQAIAGYAKGAGLDPARFLADLDGEEVRLLVARDLAEARVLGLRGTPTFFVNGRQVSDPITLVDFVDWVEEAAAVRAARRGRQRQ